STMVASPSIVLALGLRPLFENFAAGVTLQTRRPFEPGDQVSLVGTEGIVREVTTRTVLVETLAGEYVYVPNRAVLDNPIVNYTAGDTRRSILDVGLEYSTDLAHAATVIQRALSETPGVKDDPTPAVYVHTFGDSTISAALWFWHGPHIETAAAVRHHVALNVKRALDEADITIAFPQRVLWWGNKPDTDTPTDPAN
ncbi:MAG: mechanosensitive ion channel family protein, partial [Actinomycetota bacterium]|nr:mechanosensitive ion channel family protein [Actinomycetota bacterium]